MRLGGFNKAQPASSIHKKSNQIAVEMLYLPLLRYRVEKFARNKSFKKDIFHFNFLPKRS